MSKNKPATPSEMGKKGGRSRSPEKLAAIAANSRKPRPGARKANRPRESKTKPPARKSQK